MNTYGIPEEQQVSILQTKKLSKYFGGITAVDDVELSVNRSEITSLIGPNGAGKTTLFKMLSGELEPSTGTVRFQGNDITGEPPEEMARKGIGRSFQITNVFEGISVLENVRVAIQARHRGGWNMYKQSDTIQQYIDEAEEILSRVGLSDKRDEKASTLSHGDKRILEIALVLAIDPDLMLLDEPAAGMSQIEIKELLHLLEDLVGDYTIMFVEHNMDIVMDISDTVIALNNGRVIASGPPSAIQSNKSVQEAYLGGIEQ